MRKQSLKGGFCKMHKQILFVVAAAAAILVQPAKAQLFEEGRMRTAEGRVCDASCTCEVSPI